MKQSFITALQENDLTGLSAIPKTDLHSHAGRGGHKSYIEHWKNVHIDPPSIPFHSLSEMDQWFRSTIKPHCPGIEGYIKRIEAAFVQASADNIRHLALSFGIDEVANLGGIQPFISTIDSLHKTYAPTTSFYPDLSIGYSLSELDKIDEILDASWFKGIDICNYNNRYTLAQLQQLCRRLKDNGLKLKAHVGEFDSADNVMRYAEELALDEIQHGVAASSSPQIMNWLANHQIRLNICPTSNVMLKVCSDYKTHPIRFLYDYGVPVTINTDDLLIFNSTVSQEYLKLYQTGLMSAEELNSIRENGLVYS